MDPYSKPQSPHCFAFRIPKNFNKETNPRHGIPRQWSWTSGAELADLSCRFQGSLNLVGVDVLEVRRKVAKISERLEQVLCDLGL